MPQSDTPRQPESSGNDQELGITIRQRFSKAWDPGKFFIPEDVIMKLTAADKVRAHLERDRKRLFKDVSITSLVNYIRDKDKPARKVFLLLVFCGKLKYLLSLRGGSFRDEHLPIQVTYEANGRPSVRTLNMNGKVSPPIELFKPWKVEHVESFIEKQWSFMAPVFVAEGLEYHIDQRCPLPFQRKSSSKNGYAGSVFEVEMAQAHIPEKFSNKSIAWKLVHADKKEYFDREAASLRVMRNLNHNHLIYPLAAIRRGSDLGFLFPWAEGGNLEEFWMRSRCPRTKRNQKLMKWILTQLYGLCEATEALHGENCRHTDLKPQNILLFFEGERPGTLRIADVGLARIHADATRQRQAITNAKTGTVRYEAPELGDKKLSRVFDVWCLGCVFLEFLIWVLYGRETLHEFMTESEKFWKKSEGKFEQSDEVKERIRTMLKDIETFDPRSQTWWRPFLVVVDQDMLVANWNKRVPITEIRRKLKGIRDRQSTQESHHQPTSLAEATPETLGIDGGNTDAPSADMQESVRFQVQRVKFYTDFLGAIWWSASFYDLVRSVLLTVYQSQVLQLDDEWHSQSDNVFAQTFFNAIGSSMVDFHQSDHELCPRCSQIWQSDFSVSDTMEQLRTRLDSCQYCCLTYQAAKEAGLSDEDDIQCIRVNSTIRLEPDGPDIFSVHVDPKNHFSAPFEAQFGYAQLPQPASKFQITLFEEWLRTCNEHHGHQFGTVYELPTRVLEVGTQAQPRLCLLDGGKAATGSYVALSHCWGSGKRFKTLKSNIEQFRKNIDFDHLPKTFKDAVKVARALGFHYLWIDSLCIIQDDLDDWNREASRMEQVFSCADFVIAASSASSSEDGFLSTTRMQQPFVTIRTPSNGKVFISRYINNFHEDVECSVLNQRGWVLQERALARRTLHFTSSQVYWECGAGIHCESLMKLVNHKAAFLGDSEFPRSALRYFKGARILFFQNLYQTYSALKFTNVTDRSVAIKGLEERLIKTFATKGGYGIFERYLHRSLLWQRQGETVLVPITYPTGRYVPSWSWMAYKGRICYMEAQFDCVDWKRDVSSPFITRSGRKQYWKTDQSDTVPTLHCRVQSLKLEAQDISERIIFDQDEQQDVKALCCVVLGVDKSASPQLSTNSEHFVLVVKAISQDGIGQYVRVGVGKVFEGHISEDLGMSVII